ncbi:transcriptional regulator TyrR [Shewanella sp. 1_MG-2023]|uniref:HTH-type transcriptional regulatory protein TyrR n=1 Tax=Shewanella electrodiphila TaxID=934143 RepID=A0ABT0KKC4_9GAMM|nr:MULTISPECIES: transcriptional regulator TyrR [Shewanella]MCC4832138.1 transcriptional regulator TyrR [Shewanella sp. 10N.7]MCL1044292.1 transcriptional regulator TyrR [Shewanella electrodiphila]MDO6611656.1 transcriptional regulator TyrR [Shewanella sp. 7_MG-2023]MDO6771511.1 transcriptional regulator TyrR [Shewanella sp. 2_MG-2023]MDO6793840.1 transcriptional regulator TyrR [Shewanella sp. 1_MG-2023]
MRLEVSCLDRIGLAKDILEVLENYGINLIAIDASNRGFLYLQFAEIGFETLSELMPLIRKVESVHDVRTVSFMPSEQEHYALKTLLKTLPDSVFSINAKGRIRIVNESALLTLNMQEHEVIDESLNHWVQGFNFSRWLTEAPVLAQATRVQIGTNEYLAEMLPIYLPDENNASILAGAVVSLKSPARVGKQFNALQNQTTGFDNVLAVSDKMKDVLKQAKRMAQLDAPLLITGETGTGKELMAKASHDASMRREHPFIPINCAALPDSVAEEELFGFVSNEGQVVKRGLFEEAKGGTVFLDEIAEMSKAAQVKLLRLLQDGTFRRIGGDEEVRADVRIICSTQKNLAELCQSGEFREDLYYRIHVLSYHMPSLRERKVDVIPLTEMFLEHYSQQLSSPLRRISASCRDYLFTYAWPGNVRQLKNAIFRAVSMWDGSAELTVEQLKLPSYAEGFGYFDEEFEGSLDQAMKEYEASLLRRLYPAYPSTRQLAKKLGVSHTAIANKLRDYKITKKR